MTPRKPAAMKKMQTVGHYRAPSLVGYNKPRAGRVGKMLPSIKRIVKVPRRRRPASRG